jgi:TatA/E family protein of Tat protein translocase
MPTPGPLELVIILVIALLILGPGKLPDVGAALGKSIREFRKASSDVQDAVKLDTSPLPADAPPATTAAPPVSTAVQTPPVVPATTDATTPPAPAVAAAPAASVASTPASEPTAGSN